MAVKIGSYTVPPQFETVAKYLKFAVAVAAVVAAVIVHVVAGPPAWALLIIAVAGALGVGAVPNGQITAEVDAIKAAVSDGEATLAAVEAKNVGQAVEDAKTTATAAEGAVEGAEGIAKEVAAEAPVSTVVKLPVAPVNPDKK